MRQVVIDVEGRFIDNISNEVQDAQTSLNKLGKEADKTQKEVDDLSKQKAKPKIDADTSKIDKKLRDADNKLNKFKRSADSGVDIFARDKASTVIKKALSAAKGFVGRKWEALINVKDSKAITAFKKLESYAKTFAGKTWTTMVKVKDFATAPLRGIKNMLFSIKTLVMAITAGLAAKQFIINPINLADQYSSAQIGFSTLLGESAGQQMMNDLDEFAKATPFKSSEVIGQTQRMLAMGWNAEDIITDMTTIGDAAAATGKGEQGLQQIVTALAQIKTKGRLSTEELNQLAEAGISAKKYLAEGLGYGSGDEGIAKMTKDLEDGAIASDKALQALLSGMKEYQGMMDKTANETVEGLWSQIQDTFEINIFRRWGQGLQDGAKRGFGSVVELLDEADGALERFGDTVYDIGKSISNWTADKFENTIGRILEITDSYDFQNASLGEKFKMLWKGVITDPLKEWWEGGGQQKTAETAGEIGEWMGKTISDGLLAIFGVTDVFTDSNFGENGGMSVAQSFVKGFKDNFDGSAITEAFVDAIKDIWGALPTWAKLLIGGYAGGKLAIGASNLFGAVGSLVGSAGTIAAGTTTVTGASGLLGLIGRTGVSGVGASGILGGLANTGYTLLGGTSALSVGGGMAALAGGAGILGGAAGLASAGKGIYDLYGSYKAYKSGDKTESKAKAASGGTALGGVAAGAATGAAIGSIIPGLGTALGGLIGAGVGGVAGWIGGNKWADSIRETKYEVEGTAEAIKKAKTEEEKLAALNEAAWENMKSRMGDIKLSASEITRLADQIVWGGDLSSFEKFNSAVQQAEASLKSLNTAGEATDRWMWKAGLGVKFNDDEIESIKASFDDYINSAKSYVENKHYEFTAAVSLLVDVESEEGKNIIESGNAYFGGLQDKIESLGKDLSSKVKIALEDGVISLNEQKEITNLQNQIAEITQKLANAETKAELELVKLKFGGGNLSLESFDDFMAQMETTLSQRIAANDEAFKASVSTLQLQLEDGAISQEEYDKQLQTLVDGYTGKVDKVKAEILNVELDIIGDAYGDELGKDATKKLQSALEKSLAEGINPVDWTPKQAKKFLGIDDLEDDTAVAIGDMLGGVANQLELVEVDGKLLLDLGIETEGDTGEKVKEKVDKDVPETVKETVGVNISAEKEIQNAIDVVQEDFGVPKEHAATVAMLLYGNKDILNQIDVSQLAKEFGIPESQAKTIIEKLTGEKSIENKINVLASDFGVPDVIHKTVQVKVHGSVTTDGNIKMDYASKAAQLYNQERGWKYRGGIVGGGSSAMEAFAIGGRPDDGMLKGSTRFIRVNEEEPEMIIPLSNQRRDRALKLWNKTGELLDVPGFARGGSTSGHSEGFQINRYEDDGGNAGQTVLVEVGGITVEIKVDATGHDNIAEAIKEQKEEIAEAVAEIFAEEFETIFENTPVRGGVA